VATHPDDETLGCGGTLLKHRANGDEIHWLIATDIKESVLKACFDKNYREYISNLKNPYGDGYAHKNIVKFLENIDPRDDKWHIKRKLI